MQISFLCALICYNYVANKQHFWEAYMKQTTNHQLNQWDKTDRIQMEDFNADNAKIDAALAAEAAAREAAVATEASAREAGDAAVPLVKVADVTLQAAASQFDVPVGTITAEEYTCLFIRPLLDFGSTNSYCTVRCNNTTGYRMAGNSKDYGGQAYSNRYAGNDTALEIFLNANGVYMFSRSMTYQGNSDTFCAQVTDNSVAENGIQTLNFILSEDTFNAGSRVIVYGLKK